MTSLRLSALASLLLLAGCDTGSTPTTDAGPRPDAPIAPGTDAPAIPTDAPAVVGRSSGCGVASTIETGEWVEASVESGGARAYFVYLPDGYDPSRAYPIVYQLHGCSSSRESNNVPVERESGTDAIHVRGRAAADCWDTAEGGPDVPYFDAMLADAEASFCVDTERRFLAGYSSGSFMTHRLGCIRGSLLRGIASIAGGQGGGGCTGNVAALLIHDLNDGTVNISASEGARDSLAMRNGCDTTMARTPVEPSPCEALASCDEGLPVVWCQTAGMDHSRQDGLAAPAFWGFFESL